MSVVGRAATWFGGNAGSARVARAATTVGLLWALVQFADRFKLATLPDGASGLLLFVLIALSTFLVVELSVTHRRLAEALQHRPSLEDFTPEEAFANGVIRYASKLNDAQARRDTAVLEIRSFATRPLHLMGAIDARVQLGEIALGAASNIDDRLTEASILIDELGWTLHLQGSSDRALRNLASAVTMLDDLETTVGTSVEISEWRAKALRHQANIESLTESSLAAARANFVAARDAARKLPQPNSLTFLAQVDHSESEVILKFLNAQLGDDGKVDPQGPTRTYLKEALDLIGTAISQFEAVGDKERAVKASHLRVALLRHDNDEAALIIARQRLERAKLEASRIAYLP